MTHGMPPSILEFLEDRDDVSTFLDLADRSGLRDVLEADHELTVFAPKNAAFRRMEGPDWDELTNPANRERLRRMLRRQIVARPLKSAQFRDRTVETLGGWMAPLEVNKDGVVWFAGERVTRPDFKCRDGIVHFVDRIADREE